MIVVQKLNIDSARAYFVPIYAMPSMTTAAQPLLAVKLQSSRDGINGVTPEMKSMADLFRLQHLITGYRCVKQRKNVKVKTLTRGQEYPHTPTKGSSWARKPSSDLIEIGSLQLWQRSAFAPDPAKVNNCRDAERSTSDTSNSRSSTSLSTSSVMSTISSVHAQQISLGSSRTAIELKQPEPPRLVLSLKHTDTGQLSFLMIELDERTKIEPNSCDCRNSKKACSVSVLERSGTPLLAHRFYAKSGLNSWNLAALGEHWSKTDANAVRVRDMYWVRVGFNTEEERIKFNNNVADLVRIHIARLDDYRKDLNLVRGTQILTQAA
jgi:hypothetical protein